MGVETSFGKFRDERSSRRLSTTSTFPSRPTLRPEPSLTWCTTTAGFVLSLGGFITATVSTVFSLCARNQVILVFQGAHHGHGHTVQHHTTPAPWPQPTPNYWDRPTESDWDRRTRPHWPRPTPSPNPISPQSISVVVEDGRACLLWTEYGQSRKICGPRIANGQWHQLGVRRYHFKLYALTLQNIFTLLSSAPRIKHWAPRDISEQTCVLVALWNLCLQPRGLPAPGRRRATPAA